jgi:hypothetical protein
LTLSQPVTAHNINGVLFSVVTAPRVTPNSFIELLILPDLKAPPHVIF